VQRVARGARGRRIARIEGWEESYGHRLPGLEPVDRELGNSRGDPIDRHYIHEFLWPHRADVRGRVLEVADSGYTDYLGEGRVTRSDVLHVRDRAPGVTIVGNLETGEGIPRAAFDCMVLTQTLQYVYDGRAAARVIREALVPGGVALVTVPGIAQISRDDRRQWGEFWRFTSGSARRLFADAFGEDNVQVEVFGNVLVAAAYLYGYAQQELTPEELSHRDEDYEFLIGVRAVA
jgi:hypothetical protein